MITTRTLHAKNVKNCLINRTQRMVLVMLLLLAVFAVDPIDALAASVAIHVDVVYADNSSQGTDPSLRTHQFNLPYNSYQRIDTRQFQLSLNQSSSLPIPSGGRLNIQPISFDDQMIQIKVWMENASESRLNTVLRLVNGGTVIIGGMSHKSGVIVIPISAEMK